MIFYKQEFENEKKFRIKLTHIINNLAEMEQFKKNEPKFSTAILDIEEILDLG